MQWIRSKMRWRRGLWSGLIVLLWTGGAAIGAADTEESEMASGFALPSRTIDAGGISFATGGPYRLAATLGQAEAGLSQGGIYTLRGGFQVVGSEAEQIFADGFESGGLTAWSSSSPAASVR